MDHHPEPAGAEKQHDLGVVGPVRQDVRCSIKADRPVRFWRPVKLGDNEERFLSMTRATGMCERVPGWVGEVR